MPFALLAVAWARSWKCRLSAVLGSLSLLAILTGWANVASAQTSRPAAKAPAIERVLPPPGTPLAADVQARLEAEIQRQRQAVAALRDDSARYAADVEALVKAIELAVVHDEFYAPGDPAKAAELLRLADQRLKELQDPVVASGRRRPSWATAKGLQVRGFISAIDGSAQPYGLEIPDDFEFDGSPVPLIVWLHGRGDKATDLHFIQQRLARPGQVKMPGVIVMHPFGRHCNAFKFAGETDVLEAIEAVCENYPIDRDRIALWGFSMGGAGTWHLAAHYPDRFVAASPGAGFAETRRYQNLQPDNYPPDYQQTLWRMYDVPEYVRNLFNLPVIAYSGENDKQIQAAQVLEEAFAAHGRTLPHLIGPGVGHQYEPATLARLTDKMREHIQRGRTRFPERIALQTQTLRYNACDWLGIQDLQQHWSDARVDAQASSSDKTITLNTRNVRGLRLTVPWEGLEQFPASARIVVDGQQLAVPASEGLKSLDLARFGDVWRPVAIPASNERKASFPPPKSPGLQGPIDDVWLEPFLVVVPSGKSKHPAVEAWTQAELAHFLARWRALFRGEARVKRDVDVTPDDLQRYHVVAWGDPDSNALLRRAASDLPARWSDPQLHLAGRQAPADSHVPVFIYPNPLAPERYLVVNSGPTFREAHDRTNSQQVPKLPDWAIVDISTPPDARQPGSVTAAGFFDESWQVPSTP